MREIKVLPSKGYDMSGISRRSHGESLADETHEVNGPVRFDLFYDAWCYERC